MAFRNKKKEKEELQAAQEEKTLDVDASMQGSLSFRDPVNLRINGKFEGTLDTKGNLTIGQDAQVQANIAGEDIKVCGKVFGNVVASNSLSFSSTANLVGDIRTPKLSVAEGAIIQGKCDMQTKGTRVSPSMIMQTLMTIEELAKYLEVDASSILNWAKAGRIPAQKDGSAWKFDRSKVDAWIASEKIEKQ